MSDFIRVMQCKMSSKGTCAKCGNPRNSGNHSKCDRWPSTYGGSKGFHYVGNSVETNLDDLKTVVAGLMHGELLATPVRFEIRIMQTANCPAPVEDEATPA